MTNGMKSISHVESLLEAAKEEALRNPKLNVDQAARFLDLSVSTLNRWRGENFGPRWLKKGGRIFYAYSDLQRFKEFGNAGLE